MPDDPNSDSEKCGRCEGPMDYVGTPDESSGYLHCWRCWEESQDPTDRTARVLVTGSREWSDRDAMRDALTKALRRIGNPTAPVLVHGGARGADIIAAEVWAEMGYGNSEEHPADWDQHGRGAGHIRNARMVALGADICVAFPIGRSVGTRGCMSVAKKAGILVIDATEPEQDSIFGDLFD